MELIIRTATTADIPTIHALAEEIWWPAYRGVISDEQIAFMLSEMYSEMALAEQFDEGVSFLLAIRNEIPVGFAGFSETDPSASLYKLHKLYVLQSEHGKGTGKALVQEVMKRCKETGGKILELNVNRKNPSYGFYQRIGFEVYKEVDIPYHQYVLNDYVLRKAL